MTSGASNQPAPTEYDSSILLQPGDPALGYLAEGPSPCGDERLSWVSIQHGPDDVQGSLNLLDVARGRNRSWELEGRPGFAIPTADPRVFLVGCEKKVGFYDLDAGRWAGPEISVEAGVGGTIVNDALAHGDALIFGTKSLDFRTPRAGLYFWRPGDGTLTCLADRQVCSNGKVVLGEGRQVTLLDIDTPTRTVVAYPLDLDAGTVGAPRLALDLRDEPAYPDGMIATPDGRSVVIAFYDPRDVPHGQARQYGLESGELEVVWRTPGSPRVTCPQWLRVGGESRLVLTTAAEHMSPEQRNRHPGAGSLFVADAHWKDVALPEPFPLPAGVGESA